MSRREVRTGRSDGHTSRFARFDHKLLSSNAYRALSPNARSLLIELTMMENGKNNGVALYLSIRDAAARMGVADLSAATRAFAELQELGFIVMTADAHFAVKAGAGSRARFWRLTWQAVNGRQGPTNDFETAEPKPQSAARRRMERGQRALKRWRKEQSQSQKPVPVFATPDPSCVAETNTTDMIYAGKAPVAVSESATQKSENSGNLPINVVSESATYTAGPAGAEQMQTHPAIEQDLSFQRHLPSESRFQPASSPIEDCSLFDEEGLRREALEAVKRIGRGAHLKIAVAAGINEGTFSTFLHQRASLPGASLARLNRALKRAAV